MVLVLSMFSMPIRVSHGNDLVMEDKMVYPATGFEPKNTGQVQCGEMLQTITPLNKIKNFW